MRRDFDLESGILKRTRRRRKVDLRILRILNFMGNRLPHHRNIRPLLVFFTCFSIITALIVISLYLNPSRSVSTNIHKINMDLGNFPFLNLSNLVMVAGHSVYTSPKCGKADEDESWFLETYQKRLGQATTFLKHIQKGVEIAAKDDLALLLFSGGETRKDAGPRSEAQSYWAVADSQNWFGKKESVRYRALTEEHARDSFENLLFSICRFRELTGTYPYNITVVSYDFKEERFVELHRSAIRFPDTRFIYAATPVLSDSKLEATKGEALVKAQFKDDPYGCFSLLRRKKLGRNPFRRIIPYPDGCPEIEGLFGYCDSATYSRYLPWG